MIQVEHLAGRRNVPCPVRYDFVNLTAKLFGVLSGGYLECNQILKPLLSL